MEKTLLILGALAAAVWLAPAANAQTDDNSVTGQAAATKVIDKSRREIMTEKAYPSGGLQLQAPAPQVRTSAKVKAMDSVADLAGNYVMTYQTYAQATDWYFKYSGIGVTVTAIEGTDSVTISDFWVEGIEVKACVDLTSMTISIPNQIIGNSTTYGDYDIAATTSTGAPDRSAGITGTIASDGTITIDGWWGVFVTSGTSADYYFTLLYDTAIEPANATMSYNYYHNTQKVSGERTFGIIAEQTASDSLTIKNFGNMGTTVAIKLRYDSIATIDSQYMFTYYSIYDYYTYSVTYRTGTYMSISDYSATIECDTITDPTTITWGTWHSLCVAGDGFVLYTNELPQDGKIVLPFSLKFPVEETLALDGDGTADSPYLIGTPGEWNTLATYMKEYTDDMTGKFIKLTADIDFTDTVMTPLSYNRATPFNGDLDGNGKTISGYNLAADNRYYGPVATSTGTEAYIHDLTLSGTLTTEYYYTGGIVGALYGKMSNVTHKGSATSVVYYLGGVAGVVYSSATLTDAVNEGTVANSSSLSGGIAARVYGTVDNAINRGEVSAGDLYSGGLFGQIYEGAAVTNCVNEGNVTSSSKYLGGVVGSVESGVELVNCGNKGSVTHTGTTATCYHSGVAGYSRDATYINCYNEGTVSATSEDVGYLSGIVGYLNGTTGETYTFRNCYNSGDISGYQVVAGLLTYGTSSIKVVMDSCYNTGNITSTYSGDESTGAPVGGLLATYFHGTYTDCYNTGQVTATSAAQVGGLFGRRRADGNDTLTTVFRRCYNTGNVTGGVRHVGGITSYASTYLTVDSCYNTGNITSGTYSAGGIVAYMAGNGTSKVSNCWNAGTVTTGTSSCGGVVAYDVTTDSIVNCFNVGDVTAGTIYAGGVAGRCGTNMVNVYNTATVSGTDYVGGIVGLTYADSTSIHNGYSAGTVVASGSYAGNIVGVNTTSTTNWSASNTLSGTYYLDTNAIDDTDNYSTGLTYAQLASLDLGSGWTAGDNYTYPRIATVAQNGYAIAHAAAVVPADGDSYSGITGNFNVGTPDGVTWSCSSTALSIEGNAATFTTDYTGTLTLTATSGDAVVETTLTCNVELDGIGSIAADDDTRTVVDEKFYTTSGTPVAKPDGQSKSVYIVLRTYEDGTTKAVKVAQ